MQESFTLAADFNPILLDQSGITIVAPGLIGVGTLVSMTDPAQTRALTGEKSDLERAIAEAGLEDRHTIVINAPTPERGGDGRSGGEIKDDEIALSVPIGAGESALVMYVDEAGVVSFHYRREGDAPGESRSSGRRRDEFRVPLRVASARPTGDNRGFFSEMGTKVIKVIVVGVLPNAAGGAVGRTIEAWEDRYRSFEGLQAGTWDRLFGHNSTRPNSLTPYVDQRSLLFIHGTTSTTAGAFKGLHERAEMATQLTAAYGGRLLGFGHRTMSRSVAENVREFYRELAEIPGHYTFDVICHSRGGLVARAITDLDEAAMSRLLGEPWTRPRGVTVEIDRIIFVATPNAGTSLAIPSRIPQFVERLANYVNMLPDSLSVIAAGAILALAAALTETALPRVPGLADQAPDSELLRALAPPADPDRRFFAFQADYAASGGLLNVVKDGALDRIFEKSANDLVVPTAGVSQTPSFVLPPSRRMEITGGDVHHTSFFLNDAILKITELLGTV